MLMPLPIMDHATRRPAPARRRRRAVQRHTWTIGSVACLALTLALACRASDGASTLPSSSAQAYAPGADDERRDEASPVGSTPRSNNERDEAVAQTGETVHPLAPATVERADLTYADWQELLDAYARDGCFDYESMRQSSASMATLERAVTLFGVTDPNAIGSPNERMAFWINAYNVLMIALVAEHLDHFAENTVLADPPDGSTFTHRRFRVAGTRLSLDDIEHGILRRDAARIGAPDNDPLVATLDQHAASLYGASPLDPRIHFAVNCASAGCPPLRSEPYRGARIDAQLEEQTQRFLTDDVIGAGPRGVSELIASFYPQDFERDGGWRTYVARYNPAANLEQSIPYDWTLNQCLPIR